MGASAGTTREVETREWLKPEVVKKTGTSVEADGSLRRRQKRRARALCTRLCHRQQARVGPKHLETVGRGDVGAREPYSESCGGMEKDWSPLEHQMPAGREADVCRDCLKQGHL